MKKTTITANADTINKQIKSILARGKKLDASIQECAVNTMAHLAQHGDVTLVNRLISAMPNGSRVNALLTWFDQSERVEWDMEKKEFAVVKGVKIGMDEVLEYAETMWYEFKPEPEFKPFDINAEIQKLIKRATTADKDERNDIDQDTLTALQSLVEMEVQDA